MKILGLNGSPRREGNTGFLVKYALEKLEEKGIETEQINLADCKIDQCRGCYECVEAKKCTIKGDDFPEIFEKMVESDGFILGSPSYHSSMTPRLKAVLDRAGFSGRWYVNDMKDKSDSYEWKGTAFSGKLVAPVTVARRAGQNFTFAQILLWATVNDCIVPGSNYWNVGVAGKGGAVDANEDEEGKNILNHLSENIEFLLKKINK
ncbi:MAG: flavodoxin family protein [Bacillota bacterium]|nr:flavodoxin family protein [Bacillota bacterium]